MAVRRMASVHVLGRPVIIGGRVVARVDAQDRLAPGARIHDGLDILHRGLPWVLMGVVPAGDESNLRVYHLKKLEAVNVVSADIRSAVVVHQCHVNIADEVVNDNVVNGLLVRPLSVASQVHVESVVREKGCDGLVVLRILRAYRVTAADVDLVLHVGRAPGKEAKDGAVAEVYIARDVEGGCLPVGARRGYSGVVIQVDVVPVLPFGASPVEKSPEVVHPVGHQRDKVVEAADVIGVVVARHCVVDEGYALAVQERF